MITLSLSKKEYILLVLRETAVGAAMAYVLLCRSLFTKQEVSYIKSDSTETCVFIQKYDLQIKNVLLLFAVLVLNILKTLAGVSSFFNVLRNTEWYMGKWGRRNEQQNIISGHLRSARHNLFCWGGSSNSANTRIASDLEEARLIYM